MGNIAKNHHSEFEPNETRNDGALGALIFIILSKGIIAPLFKINFQQSN